MLASSKSHDERLRELESLSSSISGKLDVLIRSVSSHASTPSSAASDHASVPTAESEHGDSGKLSHAVEEQVNGRDKVDLKDDREFQDTKSEVSTVDGDLDSLFALLDDFHTLAGQHFDGIIAEYVSTAEAWRAAHMRGTLLAIVEKSPDAPRIMFNNNLRINVFRLAGRLLSLRRRAEQESLSDAVVEADEVLGISADSVASWEALADLGQRQHDQGQLLQLDHHTFRVNPDESLVRLNEWFLTVMFANPHLVALHQSMIQSLMRSVTSGSSSDALLSEKVIKKLNLQVEQSLGGVQDRDLWERLTIKSWFFDQARPLNAAGYPASHFTDSAESDMTVMASSDDIDGELHEVEGGLGAEAQHIRQVLTIPRLNLTENFGDIDLAPEKATERSLARAAEALQEYKVEPAAQLPEEMLAALVQAAKKQPVYLKPLWEPPVKVVHEIE